MEARATSMLDLMILCC